MPDERSLPSLLRNAQRDGRRRSDKVLGCASVKREHLASKGVQKLHSLRCLRAMSVPVSVRARAFASKAPPVLLHVLATGNFKLNRVRISTCALKNTPSKE